MVNKKHFFQAAMVTTLATAAFVAAAPQADAAFSDVTPNTEAAKAIDKLVAQNIVGGYTDGTFKPQNKVTRAEAAKILTLVNTKGGPVPEYFSEFSDVDYEHWANLYVNYVNGLGLLSGYGGDTFGVNDVLTRAQFAKIIAQQLGKTASNIELPFTDVEKGAWYEEGIKVLLEAGITKGTSATTFSPSQPITREQLAIFLDRAGLLESTPVSITSLDELDALADNGVEYDAETFAAVKRFISEQDRAIPSIGYYELAPRFISDNSISNLTENTFGYVTYLTSRDDDYDAKPSHFFNVTFDRKGVKHFTLWTLEGFEKHLRENFEGPTKLEGFLEEIYDQYNPTDVYIDPYYGVLGHLPLSDTFRYLALEGTEKNIIFVDYNNYDTEVSGRKAFEITPTIKGGLNDFEIKELTALFEVPQPESSMPMSIVATINGVEYNPVAMFDSNDIISVYAFDLTVPNNEIPNGATITFTFLDYNTEEETDYVYEYQNGFKLISK